MEYPESITILRLEIKGSADQDGITINYLFPDLCCPGGIYGLQFDKEYGNWSFHYDRYFYPFASLPEAIAKIENCILKEFYHYKNFDMEYLSNLIKIREIIE